MQEANVNSTPTAESPGSAQSKPEGQQQTGPSAVDYSAQIAELDKKLKKAEEDRKRFEQRYELLRFFASHNLSNKADIFFSMLPEELPKFGENGSLKNGEEVIAYFKEKLPEIFGIQTPTSPQAASDKPPAYSTDPAFPQGASLKEIRRIASLRYRLFNNK